VRLVPPALGVASFVGSARIARDFGNRPAVGDDRAVTGTLYVVGTPIGNLADITERAREVLGSVDVVAAEDTRRTRGLLSHLGIRARLVSVPAEAERERSEAVLAELRAGRDVALVTDAGMPGLSDPGSYLVARSADEGMEVRVVPGPSAAIAALVVSGLPSERASFEGFLPRKGPARAERLTALAEDPRTAVIFESPRRVAATLRDLASAGGDRRAVVARELTKMHEEVMRGTLSELAELLAGREVRGEVVIVVEGVVAEPEAVSDADLAAEARALVDLGLKPRRAASEVARRRRVPANRVYGLLVEDGGRRSI
jgi:16S rRNA (cytidine1402-2'-O)-methyltransferase